MRQGKLLTFAFLAMQCMMAVAQDYHPLVVEGKQWKEYSEISWLNRYEYTYTIFGDTVIDGEQYHKLYIEYTIFVRPDIGEGNVFYTQPKVFFAGLQEQDGRVYIHQYDKKRQFYDFTLNEGDIAFENDDYLQRVVKVDTIAVNGILRRRLLLSEYEKGQSVMGEATGYWVEGIGGSRGLENPSDWFDIGSGHYLTECIEDGRRIFTKDDFTAPAYNQDDGGWNPKADVNGDGTVDVADIATIISVMSGGSPLPSEGAGTAADVNGDGVVDVADVATIISIMAAK